MRIQTARLRIGHLTLDAARFMFDLATDPDWLRYIGDRGIHDLDGARHWIETGPMASYRDHGFGLNRLGLVGDDTPIGICGLLQRDNRVGPEIGFALLPAFRGQGYAREAAAAIIDQARQQRPALFPIYAIVTPDNLASRRLLAKLGFVLESDYRPQGGDSTVERYQLEL